MSGSLLRHVLCAPAALLLLFGGCAPQRAEQPPEVRPAAGPAAARGEVRFSGPCEADLLTLLPLIVEAMLPPPDRRGELLLDLETFEAGARLFCGAPVRSEWLASAIGQPFRDVVLHQGAMPGPGSHVRLEALVWLGDRVEVVARRSSLRTSGYAAGQTDFVQYRLIFRRQGYGYVLESRTPLMVT